MQALLPGTRKLSAMVLPIAIGHHRTVTRGEGVFLLIVHLSYLAWRVAGQA